MRTKGIRRGDGADLLDVIVGGALALREGRPSKWSDALRGMCAPKVVRDLSAPMPSGASLSKNWKAGSKRLEDIRNSTVASFISSSFPGVRRRSS